MDKSTFDHVTPTPEDVNSILEIREGYKALEAILSRFPKTRCMSVALTNLEQSAMWAIKSIALKA